jgi:hypothetical protein
MMKHYGTYDDYDEDYEVETCNLIDRYYDYDEGCAEGYETGFQEGYDEGYGSGFQEGISCKSSNSIPVEKTKCNWREINGTIVIFCVHDSKYGQKCAYHFEGPFDWLTEEDKDLVYNSSQKSSNIELTYYQQEILPCFSPITVPNPVINNSDHFKEKLCIAINKLKFQTVLKHLQIVYCQSNYDKLSSKNMNESLYDESEISRNKIQHYYRFYEVLEDIGIKNCISNLKKVQTDLDYDILPICKDYFFFVDDVKLYTTDDRLNGLTFKSVEHFNIWYDYIIPL